MKPFDHQGGDPSEPIDVTPDPIRPRRPARQRALVIAAGAGAIVLLITGGVVAATRTSGGRTSVATARGGDLGTATAPTASSSSPTGPEADSSDAPSSDTATSASVTSASVTSAPTASSATVAGGDSSQASPSEATTTEVAPVAGPSATPQTYPAHAEETLTMTVDGPTQVVAGQPETYVLHWTWSAERPDYVDFCWIDSSDGCPHAPLAFNDGPTTTTPPPGAQPGSMSETETATFEDPGTADVHANCESTSGQYFNGDAEAELEVTVAPAPSSSASTSPPSSPSRRRRPADLPSAWARGAWIEGWEKMSA